MRCNNVKPVLYIIVPCYNEESVLPVTSEMFLKELMLLIGKELISENSRILFVNDGSDDDTWKIIKELVDKNSHFVGISQSRNRGHQNAVWAGLMDSKEKCDITISIDCDGQDDISAMEDMVCAYHSGAEIVYGVRKDRTSDTFFKRFTAETFYYMLNKLGAEVVFNHADYRLVSSKVLFELSKYKEVNLFLRGLIPLVGFNSSCVFYERHKRIAGSSHYPFRKMIALAIEGITSLSVKPLKMISNVGMLISFLSFIAIVWAVVEQMLNKTVSGWASIISIICFLGGIQLCCLGILGEYIGKIYLEVKGRPRYIISERVGGEIKTDAEKR